MSNITNTSQLDILSVIRTIILTDSVLSGKFSQSDFYLFQPNLKSLNVRIPYFVISIPESDTEVNFLNDIIRNKQYRTSCYFDMEYTAKDNAPSYLSRTITAIDNGNSTFKSSGYDLIDCRTSQPFLVTNEEKLLVRCPFDIILGGETDV